MNDGQAQQAIQSSLAMLTLEKVGWALFTLVMCLVAVRVVMAFTARAVGKLPLEKTLSRFLLSAIRLVLYFIAALIVADKLGIPVTSLVAVFSVVGLAISLAVQDSLTNLFSGLTILVSKPFVVGDYVEMGGMSGTVDSIGLTYTRLLSADNKLILMPNKAVSAEKVINYTSQATRRVELKVRTEYAAPAEKVKAALLEATAGLPGALSEPAPFAGLHQFEANGIEYVLRVWTAASDYWDVYYDLMERVKCCFERQGLTIPFAQLDVRLKSGENQNEDGH